MDSLIELKEKLLREAKKNSIEYKSTSRETSGRSTLIKYDIDYDALKTELEAGRLVGNMSWTLPKVREVFKIIRKVVGFDDPRRSKSEEEDD